MPKERGDGKRKVKGKSEACYVRVNSQLDLARHACDFAGAPRAINAVKEGGRYRLFSVGEKIGDTRLLYCCDADRIGKFCVYDPGEEAGEKVEMRDDVTFEPSDMKHYRIPIVELDKNPYTLKDDAKLSVRQVHAKDYTALVKAVINNAANDSDGAPKVYGFFSRGEHFIGSYELFRESGARFFAYAKVSGKGTFGSISYNYTDGTVETSNSFAGKSHIYVRVINLSAPFPFSKS